MTADSVTPRTLSTDYELEYAELLATIASTPRVEPAELTLFWPQIGSMYSGDLLVVGRAVNGWIDHWRHTEPNDLAGLARTARATSERGSPLQWVLDRWGSKTPGYRTSRSQFWSTIRQVVLADRPDLGDSWANHIAWTNVVKVAPSSGGNPGGNLLALQRTVGPRLLAREVAELAPRRVVAFTGRWWFEPFAEALGLDVKWSNGLVEGVAKNGGRTWVIAVHPMTKSPRAVADAVTTAIAT